jgi:hypothetical protein
MATVQEQFDAFMKSPKSKKPHVGLLVEGFKRAKNQISFQHNGKQIIIPLDKVLYPRKQYLKPEDFIDPQLSVMLIFISGATINRLTPFHVANSTPVCTCTVTCFLTTALMPYELPLNIENMYFLPELALADKFNDNILG